VDGITFYPGVSYRNLAIIRDSLLSEGKGELKTTPPHDILDKAADKFLPEGKGSVFLNDVMKKASALIEFHEVNKVRVDLNENPANAIWLWGQGRTPAMPDFKEQYGLKGAVISAVDLIRGISKCAGLDIIEVPGITGYIDTDYAAKGRYGLNALEDHDIVIIHIEAPDEAGHNGDKMTKVQAIEQIDEKIVGPVMERMQQMGQYRVLVTPDHPTPIVKRTHTSDPVPFVLWGTGVEPDSVAAYSEQDCREGRFGTVKGHEMIEKILIQRG
jgi:2,3-bisphosphoglycerate-independent phosphoglycerate mutase